MPSATIRSAAPALLLSLLVLAPFLGKAFTLDDTVFMREAEHALVDPVHPTSFEMVWGDVPERVSKIVPTGPVLAWLLAPSALAGGVEWIAHAVELATLWLGILATVSLALRIGYAPAWATAAGLLLAAMPAVLAMAGTAMPDVPAMGVGACAIERFVAWSQERRPSQAVAATLLLGLAALTRTHAVLLVGVAAVLAVPRLATGSLRDRLTVALPLLVAPVVILGVLVVVGDPHHDSGNIVAAATRFSSTSIRRLASNAVALPIHWTLAMAFALPWLALRWREVAATRSGVLGLVLGFALSATALALAGLPVFPLALVATLGFAAIWDVIAGGWTDRDWVRMALGCWLLLALSAAPYVNLPPKLLVVSAPAAALLVSGELARRGGRTAGAVLGLTVALGVGLGVAILRSDSARSELGRRAVAEMIAPRVAAGQRVWFVGHWGFQWYAEKAGARPATLTPPYPAPGEFLVVSLGSDVSVAVLEAVAKLHPDMTQVGELLDRTPGGRIMNAKLGAGFYSNAWGYLPWAWGDEPVDVFLAYAL